MEMADEQVYSQASPACQSVFTTVTKTEKHEDYKQDQKRGRTVSSTFLEPRSIPSAKRSMPYFTPETERLSSENKESTIKKRSGTKCELKALICMKVDPQINTKENLNFHFSKFGVLTHIKCDPLKNYAYIKFKTHAGAAKAKKKGSIFSDDVPPMKLYWTEKNLESKKKSSNSPDFATSQNLEEPVINEKEKYQITTEDDLSQQVAKTVEISRETSKRNRSEKIESILRSSETKKLIEKLQMPAHTIEEKLSRLEDRDKLLHMAETNEYEDNLGQKMNGTCLDMCPEKERYMRKVTFNLSVLETTMTSDSVLPKEEGLDHRYIVKEYSRSSADQQKPLPHELRPPRVLLNTMNYLVCSIMNLKGDPFLSLKEWYNFLWNRTRSIRKDIAQQQLCDPICVEIMEKCTRFHILCIGELWNQPLSTFEPKINNENLTKSLQTLKHMYADLRSNGIKCPNEAEFRGYDILLSLSEGESLRLIKDLKSEIRKSAEVKFALNTALALTSRNYIRFFKLMESATYLKRCILMRFLNKVRIEAIQVIIRAFCPPNRSMMYPTLDLMQNLRFQSCSETIEFCETLGLNATQESVRLHKKSLNIRDVPQKIIKSSFLVRDKSKSISHIVCNDTVPENPIQFYEPSNIFDEDGYLQSIISAPADNIYKIWKYAGLSIVDASTSPIPEDLFEIEYSVDASNSPIPDDLLEIDCKPMKFTVELENTCTFDEIKSEGFSKSNNQYENECIDMIDVELEADHKNTCPEIYLDIHDGNFQNVLQEIASPQNVSTPKFLDVSQHFNNKQIFSFDMHSQYIWIDTEANETKPNETSFPPDELQINKNIFVPDNIRNEVPNECEIFDQRIEAVLHPVGIAKSDMKKSELNNCNVDRPVDMKFAFHSNEFITKQEMFENKPMDTFESNTKSKTSFKRTKTHTPAEELSDVSDQLPVKYLLFDALSRQPSKEERTVILSNLLNAESNNLTSLIGKDEDLPNECEEKEKVGNSLHRETAFLVKDKENFIFADELNFVADQNKTLLEETDARQIKIHLENKKVMLAQKVIYKWLKYCLKRKAERTLNNSLPVHPLLGLSCYRFGHKAAMSPIAIMRNNSACKTTDYDQIFSYLLPSNCVDFLPTFRTLRVASNKIDAPYLKGTATDKFWKLLLVLPEEKSDEMLMLIIKWIIAKFSAQKIKRCEDGSYVLSCFQLPICSKNTVICVRALVLNETSAKAIENSSALVCGLSAMLVVFPKCFQDEHNLNDFYELLECFLYRVCLKTVAIPPICILLLDSINKFDASEKINCFLQKCKNVAPFKVTSFPSNIEMTANLIILKQVIAWLIENEVEYPEIEALSLIKYVENASSFAINYMHRELSYANIDLSTVLPNHIIKFFNKVIQYQASVLNSSYIKRLICSPQELHFVEPSFKFSFNENFQDTANKFMESMILPLNDGDLNTINVWDFIADVATSSGCDFSQLAFNIQCRLAEVISNTRETFPLADVILTCALHIFNHKCTEAGIDMNSSVYWLKEEMNSTYYDELWENCMQEYYSSSYRKAHTTKCRSDSPEIIFNRPIVYSLTNKKCDNLDKSNPRSLTLELSKEMSNAAQCNWSMSQLEQFQSLDRFSSNDCNTFHTHEIKLQCSQVLDNILHEKKESEKFLKKLEDAVNFKN